MDFCNCNVRSHHSFARDQLVPGSKVEFSDYLVGLILVLGGKKIHSYSSIL